MRSEGSETKRRLRASGVVRSLPSSRTSPFCVSMRHRGRSTCRRDPIRLSPSVALCYHPWWADPPSYWAVRARILLADPKGTAYGGLAFSSHLRRKHLLRTRVNKGKKDTHPRGDPIRIPCDERRMQVTQRRLTRH